MCVHTDGPANKEVPESAIAEQPLAQYSVYHVVYVSQKHGIHNVTINPKSLDK